MNYDWFVDINEIYKPKLLKICDLDRNIRTEMDKGKKYTLKENRKKLWDDTWEKICETIPSYSSLVKLLSSVSFEQESLQDILRERYIETLYKKKDQISNCPVQLEGSSKILEIPKINNINDFPFSSFFLQFTFTLAKPFLSRDDEEFYICDNPVRKDKIFKVPMVSGSTWKGNMRWTAGRLLEMDTDENERFKKRMQISNLFGNETESEKRYFDALMPDKKEAFEKKMRCLFGKEGIRRGRLNFYPTFFDRISLEVINPHDRKTKAGTVPIYIESVPEGTTGTFSLLYVPFDLIGKPTEDVKQQASEDINLVYNSLKEMMLTYGFSAKKSSGFGIIQDNLEAVIEGNIQKDIFGMSGHTSKKSLPTPELRKEKTFFSFKELLNQKKETNSSTVFTFSKLKELIQQINEEVAKQC